MHILVKRILANTINVCEGMLFAVILYFGTNLKDVIRIDFLFYFIFCYIFADIVVLLVTKRKTLGEVFVRIRLVKQSNKDAKVVLMILREFIFALVLILTIHDPIVWGIVFLVFTVPYDFERSLNGLDFLFNTKHVDDSNWESSKLSSS